MHDPFVVDQHAIGNRIIVADDRIDEFVDEGIGSKPNFLTANCTIAERKPAPGMSECLREPGLEPGRDAAGLRHAADPGRMLHHALALGHGKLAEQEKPLAGRGSDPVRIAAAGIQEGGLGRLGCCFGEVDQFVLDLEWAQGLEFPQCHNVGHDLLLLFDFGRQACHKDKSW